MSNTVLFTSILLMGVCTLLLRALPYLLLSDKTAQTPWLVFIKRMMPPGMMIILVLFCVQDIDFINAFDQSWHTLAAMVITALVHQKWRNPFLSIVIGTGVFMSLQGGLLTTLLP